MWDACSLFLYLLISFLITLSQRSLSYPACMPNAWVFTEPTLLTKTSLTTNKKPVVQKNWTPCAPTGESATGPWWVRGERTKTGNWGGPELHTAELGEPETPPRKRVSRAEDGVQKNWLGWRERRFESNSTGALLLLTVLSPHTACPVTVLCLSLSALNGWKQNPALSGAICSGD